MSIKLIAPVALAFGLSMSGAAFAQTMVGGNEVSDADLAQVTTYCEELVAAQDAQDSTQQAPNGGEDAEGGNDTPAGDSTLNFDITTITLDQCKEAGLVE